MHTTRFEPENPGAHPAGQAREYGDQVQPQIGLGSPIRIQVWFRRGLLGPAWAAMCGGLASGRLSLSPEPLLRLALLVFLVDVLWGGLWSALAGTDWATPLRHWQRWRRGSPVRFLPYLSSDGPAGRLARSWGQLRSWWGELARPTHGPTLTGLAVVLPLALIVAAVLGMRPLLATLAAITVLQFVFVWTRGDASPVPHAQALFDIALPWLAGHALLDALELPSVALGLAFAVSYAGGLRMAGSQPGLGRWNLGQLAAIFVLVIAHQPLLAGVLGLLVFAQAVFQPGLFDPETDEVEQGAAIRFLRWAQPWLMAAMLIAAWGLQAGSTGG